jgi:hypothetical protein
VSLFKYVSPDRIDVLLNKRLRFTQAADFNDPFEVVPHIAALLPPAHEDEYLQSLMPDANLTMEQAVRRELDALPLPPAFKELAHTSILQQYAGGDLRLLAISGG